MTAYLKNGGTLENAALMANHASTRTTQLYDRHAEEVTLDEVERLTRGKTIGAGGRRDGENNGRSCVSRRFPRGTGQGGSAGPSCARGAEFHAPSAKLRGSAGMRYAVMFGLSALRAFESCKNSQSS